MKKIIKKILRLFGFDIVRYKDKRIKYISVDNLIRRYDTATGKYFLPNNAPEDAVMNAIINDKIFEEDVVDCARRYINKGTAVLDIGSNFGQMSIIFSKLVTSSGKVYSFDADDFIFDLLKKNINVNKCENIIPIFGAVYNRDKDILFFPKQDFQKFKSYGAYGIDPNSKQGRTVQSITIDSLNIQEKISLMKIDIQGADLQAMQGAVNTIKKNKMPIIFEFEYLLQDEFKLDFQEYIDFVNSIDYKFDRVIGGHNYLIIPK